MHTAQASGSRKRWNLEGLWSLAGKRYVVWTRSRSSCNSTDWLLVSLFVSPLPSVPIHSFVPFMITSYVLTHPTRLQYTGRSILPQTGQEQTREPGQFDAICPVTLRTVITKSALRIRFPPRSAKQKSQNGLELSLSRSLSQHPASSNKPLQ